MAERLVEAVPTEQRRRGDEETAPALPGSRRDRARQDPVARFQLGPTDLVLETPPSGR